MSTFSAVNHLPGIEHSNNHLVFKKGGDALNKSYQIAKLTCPVLPPTILHRESLVTRLNEIIAGGQSETTGSFFYKLLLVCAPTGYGKTTLLVDFVQYAKFPCCWYHIEDCDNNVLTFMRFFVASIQQRFPHFNPALISTLSEVKSDDMTYIENDQIEIFLDMLIMSVKAEIPERFAFILCNYQEVNENQAINNIVNSILQRLPPWVILVIESRAIPHLQFAMLLARRQVYGIDGNMLRFTPQEIRDLARIQHVEPINDVEAEQVATLFNGWITGILLGTRLGDVNFLLKSRNTSPHPQPLNIPINRQIFFPTWKTKFSRKIQIYIPFCEIPLFFTK